MGLTIKALPQPRRLLGWSSRSSGARSSASDSGHITAAAHRPWEIVGDASIHLRSELERMYWLGVEEELESVLVALRAFQAPENQEISLPDEADPFIHGFDTFIDQVSDESRAFAKKVEQWKEQLHSHNGNSDYRYVLGHKRCKNYDKAVELSLENSIIEKESSQLKAALRIDLLQRKQESLLHHRARSLLQAIGLLDMDKMIEYRPPSDVLSFWKRPAIPQLQLKSFGAAGLPIFIPQTCFDCGTTIKGAMYVEIDTEKGASPAASHICEECHRRKHVKDHTFTKLYKHCILDEVMTPARSRRMCDCDGTSGLRNESLYPISAEHKHDKAARPGTMGCGLLKLPDLIVEAKYEGIGGGSYNKKLVGKIGKGTGRAEDAVEKRKRLSRQPTIITQPSQQAADRDRADGTTVAVGEAEADSDVPLFLRKYTEKYPFGNVHMALRIGPLMIENGVEHTRGGALISVRESPVLYSRKVSTNGMRCLALSEGETRQVWSQQRPRDSKPKRYKAIMKQIVGLPFVGLLDDTLEDTIIAHLIHASRQPFDEPGLSHQERARSIKILLRPCLDGIQRLIGSRLSTYLDVVAGRLLHPDTTLRWSPKSNNCQNFCDALIDRETFSSLVNPRLYLFSFVCRPTAYSRPTIKSKFDVPQGLTEEYLLRFRFGRHDEADMIDTLQEYWYDWGAFGRQLYQYQDLFPWDCTEAFGRYPQRCGECNLAKHIWAFPFDSWSTIALHLARDMNQYQAPADGHNSDTWLRNRLLVLTAQSKLIQGAAAMIGNPTFARRTTWLHRQPDANVDRVKLGGIHRAQPFSHVYDHRLGRYQHYFIASWATLPHEQRIAEYELLRDGRMRLPDVEYAAKLYAGDDLDKILQRAYGGGTADAGRTADSMMAGVGFAAAADAGAGSGCAANCAAGCGSADPGAAEGGDGGGCGGGGVGGGGGGGCGGGGGGGGGGGCGGGGGGGCGGCGG